MVTLNKNLSFVCNYCKGLNNFRLGLQRPVINNFRGFSTTMASYADNRPAFKPTQSFRLTEHPDEEWKLGEGLKATTEVGKKWKAGEEKGWQAINLDEMEKPSVKSLPLQLRCTHSDVCQ